MFVCVCVWVWECAEWQPDKSNLLSAKRAHLEALQLHKAIGVIRAGRAGVLNHQAGANFQFHSRFAWALPPSLPHSLSPSLPLSLSCLCANLLQLDIHNNGSTPKCSKVLHGSTKRETFASCQMPLARCQLPVASCWQAA